MLYLTLIFYKCILFFLLRIRLSYWVQSIPTHHPQTLVQLYNGRRAVSSEKDAGPGNLKIELSPEYFSTDHILHGPHCEK